MSDRGRRVSGASSSSSSEGLLSEAETLQQRAERKRGQDAAPAYQQAAAKFREAIAAGQSPERHKDALVGLGEVLQMGASALLEATAALPDEELSLAAEQQAADTACEWFQQAVAAYQQVLEPDGRVRADAAVNCGNTLSAWAEALEGRDGEAALQLLAQSVQAYQVALTQEEDAGTLSNLADALAQQAAAMCRCNHPAGAEAIYQQAMDSYERACSMTDSAAGDDLPGLLYNWGVAQHTMSAHVTDVAAKAAMLDAAARKLRDAASFDLGDTAPHNALGDVLAERADLASTPLEAAAALEEAAVLGYQAALNISRTNPDGLVGMAEVHAAKAKLALQAGDPNGALAHHQQSAAFYRQALYNPTKLGGFRERCEVRYNAACAMALAGDGQGAAALLACLLAVGGTSTAELAADSDFQFVASQAWFQQLLKT